MWLSTLLPMWNQICEIGTRRPPYMHIYGVKQHSGHRYIHGPKKIFRHVKLLFFSRYDD